MRFSLRNGIGKLTENNPSFPSESNPDTVFRILRLVSEVSAVLVTKTLAVSELKRSDEASERS